MAKKSIEKSLATLLTEKTFKDTFAESKLESNNELNTLLPMLSDKLDTLISNNTTKLNVDNILNIDTSDLNPLNDNTSDNQTSEYTPLNNTASAELNDIKAISIQNVKWNKKTHDILKESFRDESLRGEPEKEESTETYTLPIETDKKEKKVSNLNDYGLVGKGLDLAGSVASMASGFIGNVGNSIVKGLGSALFTPTGAVVGTLGVAIASTISSLNTLSGMYDKQADSAEKEKKRLSKTYDPSIIDKIETKRWGPTAELESYSAVETYTSMNDSLKGKERTDKNKDMFEIFDNAKENLISDAGLSSTELESLVKSYNYSKGKEYYKSPNSLIKADPSLNLDSTLDLTSKLYNTTDSDATNSKTIKIEQPEIIGLKDSIDILNSKIGKLGDNNAIVEAINSQTKTINKSSTQNNVSTVVNNQSSNVSISNIKKESRFQ